CVCSVHFLLFFFFSSRRRHTRCYRDWSSDVCSSDLARVRSKLRSQLKPTLPGGADGIVGMVAPRACNCEVVSKLAATKSRPVGRSEERRVGKECRLQRAATE